MPAGEITMALNGSVVVNELIQIIHSEAGVNASRLSEHSRLNHDFGIGGDDWVTFSSGLI
jgi:hypothetical protein